MALFHLSVTQTKRSAGQSAIASAAYRAGERLYSEYYGEYSDYTRKGGVICSDILLPSHAPPEYADRQTLWNAVEKAERGKNAQLAYSFDIALQNEFSLEENIALARQFLLEQFVSRGMVVDFAVHQPDREDGGIPNPHFHVLCPIRPIEQKGGCKAERGCGWENCHSHRTPDCPGSGICQKSSRRCRDCGALCVTPVCYAVLFLYHAYAGERRGRCIRSQHLSLRGS